MKATLRHIYLYRTVFLENESNSWDTFTCVGRLICPEGHVSSLNKSNPTNHLADLGCTVDHLGPTPANLIPPGSFAVSCDLKALWPDVLGCWGMGGRCTTWPINPPEVYTSFGPDPPGRQAAGCPCQSIGWRLCSQSLCADVGWSVCWHCLL